MNNKKVKKFNKKKKQKKRKNNKSSSSSSSKKHYYFTFKITLNRSDLISWELSVKLSRHRLKKKKKGVVVYRTVELSSCTRNREK